MREKSEFSQELRWPDGTQNIPWQGPGCQGSSVVKAITHLSLRRIFPPGSLPTRPAHRLRQPPDRPCSARQHEILPEVLLLSEGLQPDGPGSGGVPAGPGQRLPGQDMDPGGEVQGHLGSFWRHLPDHTARQGETEFGFSFHGGLYWSTDWSQKGREEN